MYKDPKFIVLENKINNKYAKIIAKWKTNDEFFEHKFVDLLEFDQKHAHTFKVEYLQKKEQTLAVAKFQHDFHLGLLKFKYEKSQALAAHNKTELARIKKDVKVFKITSKDKLNQKSFGVSSTEIDPKQKYRKAQLIAWKKYNAEKDIVKFKMWSQLLLAKIDEKSITQAKRLSLLKSHDLLELNHKQSLELKKNRGDAKQISAIKTKFEKEKLAIVQKYSREIAKHKELLKHEKKNHPLVIAKQKYHSGIEHCKSTFKNIKQRRKENIKNLSKKFHADKVNLHKGFKSSSEFLKTKYKKQIESIKISNKHKKNKAEIKNKQITLKKELKASIAATKKTFDNNVNTLRLKFLTSVKHESDEIKIASNELFVQMSKLSEAYKVDSLKVHEQKKDLIKPYAHYCEAIDKIQEVRHNFRNEYREEVRNAKIKLKECRFVCLKNLSTQLKNIKNDFLVKDSKVRVYYDDLKRKLIEKKKVIAQQKNANFESITKQIDQCKIDKNAQLKVLNNNYKMQKYALVSDADKKIGIQWSKLVEVKDSVKTKLGICNVTFHEQKKQFYWEYRHGITNKIKNTYANEFKRVRDAYQKHLFALYLQYRHELGLVSVTIDAIPGTVEWYKLTKIDPAFAQMDKDIQNNIKEFTEYSSSSKELLNLNKKNKISVLPPWAPIFINVALIISWSWTLILIILTFLGAFGVVPQFVFTEADGTLSMFGVIACSIFAIIVVLNFAGFLLHNVNIKSMRSIEVKKRNDMIVFLQNQVSDYNKKINQLSKISKNGNDLIYKKALNICKQTTEATLKKLDQNIREKNEQLNKIAKYKDNEINNLKKTNLKLIAQKNALEKKMLHSQNQPMKKV